MGIPSHNPPASGPPRALVRTTVIRHRKERIAKCSLRHLHDREDVRFLRETDGFFFDGTEYTLLDVDAPLLGPLDRDRPLLLLDATWRWLPRLRECVTGSPVPRSLPPVPTAYPRVTKLFEDPEHGLASVEALYLARTLLGDEDPTLLEGYRWAETFRGHVTRYLTGLTGDGLPSTSVNHPS